MTKRDFITILTVRSPADTMMTKRLFRATNGMIGKADFDNPYLFDVDKIAIDDIADLAEALLDLKSRPNKVLIRGNPIGGTRNVRRLLKNFEPVDHHWIMADFDDVPLPLCVHPDDREIALGYLVRLLPPAFHDASYYWQWSSGHGIKPNSLRAHLFFWCADKYTDKEFEIWARWVNGNAGERVLDPSVLRTVQPNYTSAPIIGEGVADPVPPDLRSGVFMGDKDEVSINIPTLKWEHHLHQLERDEYEELVEYGLRKPWVPSKSLDGSDKYLDEMMRIGDDKDGFYEPMRQAMFHWAREHTMDEDQEFKDALRIVVRSARCTRQRDLDAYLSDYKLDASLRGAREKLPKPMSPLEQRRAGLKWRHSNKEI